MRSRTSMLAAVHGKARKLKATEIVLAFHVDAHDVDPIYAPLVAILMDSHRLMLKRAHYVTQLAEVFSTAAATELPKWGGWAAQFLHAAFLLLSFLPSKFTFQCFLVP